MKNETKTIKQAFPAFLKATENTRVAAQTLSLAIGEAHKAGKLESELNPLLAKLNNDAKADGTPEQIEAYGIANRIKSMVYDVTQGAHSLSKVKGGKGYQVSIAKTRNPSKPSYAKIIGDLKRTQDDIAKLPKSMQKKLADLSKMLEASIAAVSDLTLEHVGVAKKLEIPEDMPEIEPTTLNDVEGIVATMQ